MKRTRFLEVTILSLVSAFLISGCSLPQSKPKPVYYYTLAGPPVSLTFGQRLPFVVRVERFTATPPFNTQRIIYGDKGLHRNAYAHFKWIAEPGELLAYNLARDLQQADAFNAVLTPDAASPPTHTVHGWVEEFLEEDFSHPANACLRLNISLIDARRTDPVQCILFQKTYDAKAPCEAKTPEALSQAMSTAAAEINAQIIRDIYEHLAQRP